MVATTLHSVTMVFWKEIAYAFRFRYRRWNRNAVSLLSSVTVVMRLPISYCEELCRR